MTDEKHQQQQEVLEKILRRHRGKIQADKFLEVVAREGKDNPFYDSFLWDDSLAGHQYRLVQARHILRSFKFDYTHKGETKPVHVRRTLHLETDPEKMKTAYVATEVALETPEYKKQLQGQCRREYAQWRAKWVPLLGEGFVDGVL